ncbi:hypothetical protein [Bowmanella pacifica]|uniref:DegT/DnrJ/EryC1/StrS aminotransferase family protein n=1 Tax=Bowmanella pacifica TaxID=502051 RepID=A0A917YRT3_9ALTE|nr:hypothetical protein [Bowmanella pacifica]GGO63767.1 hypothetical protein GCM10010982_01570 [Bowmanella pacifica]
MTFLPPLADAACFAPPSIKALADATPLFSPEPAKACAYSSLLYNRARHALFHIGMAIDAKRIWVPAYHCPAMVEPFIAAGMQVAFYPVNTNLSADLNFLGGRLEQQDALLGVRYFGFDSGVPELAELCQKTGALLIEDLAHAAVVDKLYGQLAVTSLVKFYPVQVGAELLIADGALSADDLNAHYRQLPGALSNKWQSLVQAVQQRLHMKVASGYRYFDARDVSRLHATNTRQYLETRPARQISEKRRANYMQMAKRLADSSYGSPLFPVLPEQVTPYVLPFLLSDESGFNHIRQHGVQIYRWEELVPGECQVSMDYRRHLVQLPCHQGLEQSQIDFIVGLLD